uniref:Putative ovule protein n=1 Tax=Solanum chacoense TaxID=4108 RepID=A0A0V0GXN4_SOLCH
MEFQSIKEILLFWKEYKSETASGHCSAENQHNSADMLHPATSNAGIAAVSTARFVLYWLCICFGIHHSCTGSLLILDVPKLLYFFSWDLDFKATILSNFKVQLLLDLCIFDFEVES